MDQNQCVPNWDLDDVGRTIQPPPPPPPPSRSFTPRSLPAGHDNSMSLDYEMAELAWENGQLTLLGLVQQRAPDKNNYTATPGSVWTSKQSIRANDTLESIVDQATHKLSPPVPLDGTREYKHDPVPLNPNTVYSPAPTSVPSDALVPNDSNHDIGVSKGGVKCSARVGSFSVAGTPRVPVYSDWSANASESDQLRSMTTYGATSTSIGASLDNTTVTVTIDDRDHDSVCHSMPQRKRVHEDDNLKKSIDKSTSSGKRRTAAVHNQSERKRRDKINQRMKTLQKLVPNSKKTDKASMLDEVIDYMKQLQAQVQVFNTMHLPSMMTPLALQQQLQMSMLAPMGMGMGMGMNMDQMNMSINAAMAAPPNIFGLPHPVLNPAAYMSLAANSNGCDYVTPQAPTQNPLSAYLACQQSLPVTMDAYNRVAAMYQHFQQQSLNQSEGGTPR